MLGSVGIYTILLAFCTQVSLCCKVYYAHDFLRCYGNNKSMSELAGDNTGCCKCSTFRLLGIRLTCFHGHSTIEELLKEASGIWFKSKFEKSCWLAGGVTCRLSPSSTSYLHSEMVFPNPKLSFTTS